MQQSGLQAALAPRWWVTLYIGHNVSQRGQYVDIIHLRVCVCFCGTVSHLPFTSSSTRVQYPPSPPTPLNVWWGRWKEWKGRGGSCLESPQKPLMASQSYDSEKRQLVLVWVRVPVFPSCLSTCVSVLRDRCPAGPMTLRFVDFFFTFFSFFFLPLNICFIVCCDITLSALFLAISQVRDVLLFDDPILLLYLL